MSNRGSVFGQSEHFSEKKKTARALWSEGSDLFRIRLNLIQGHGPGWELRGPQSQSPLLYFIT